MSGPRRRVPLRCKKLDPGRSGPFGPLRRDRVAEREGVEGWEDERQWGRRNRGEGRALRRVTEKGGEFELALARVPNAGAGCARTARAGLGRRAAPGRGGS